MIDLRRFIKFLVITQINLLPYLPKTFLKLTPTKPDGSLTYEKEEKIGVKKMKK